MLIALVDQDLVVGRGSGIMGPEIPIDLLPVPDVQLRFVDGAVVDASGITNWFIDGDGLKHIAAGEGRQALVCRIDAPLERVGGVWEVRSVASELIAYAKAVRYAAEVAGTTVSGAPIRTDRDTRSALLEAQAAIAMDAEWSTPWELSNGAIFIVDATTLPPIVAAVAAHRRAAFVAYDGVKNAIEAGSVTTREQIDAAFGM